MPFIIIAFCLGAALRKISAELQTVKSELGQIAQEAIGNIRTVKAFACEKTEMGKFEKVNKNAYTLGIKMVCMGSIFSFLVTLLF